MPCTSLRLLSAALLRARNRKTMASPLSALLERSGNPAIGAYESLRLVQGSRLVIFYLKLTLNINKYNIMDKTDKWLN